MLARLVGSVVTVAVIATGCASRSQPDSTSGLPLRPVGIIPLPGDNSRFDYASVDAQRELLFVAHLGASDVVALDTRAARVVWITPNISQVHGVLVVDSLDRVFATATGTNQVVAIDEKTGAELGRGATGEYPDGLAYDTRRNAIWTTNEAAGTETVVDAGNLQPRATVDLGGEVGNVSYDATSDRMLVAVQGRNDMAVIDPGTMTVDRRVRLPGCVHPHGLTVDAADAIVFVACDQNATVVTVDETDWHVAGTNRVGDDPDVIAYDGDAHRLYVAAESGTVAILDLRHRALVPVGMGRLAVGAHVVALDPVTHRSYYPVPNGQDGHPAVLVRAAT